MAKENKTKYAILGVLSIKPASGYDIKKFCDQSIAHFWNENYGHIYPVLKQLERDGWVEKVTEVNEGKLRHVYHITELGKEKLIEWLRLPAEVPQARYEFLLKMFFAKDIEPQTVIDKLTQSKTFCQAILEQYRVITERLKEGLEGTSKDKRLIYWYSTVRYGIYNMEATIRWCEESIELIRSSIEGGSE